MIERYYQVLGLTKGATIEQVKKVYRKRAKLLHPDLNNAPNAHNQFIELNEAYEYLEKYLDNKVFDERKRVFRKSRSRPKSKRKETSWTEREKQRARARARSYSRMEYQEYTKTDFYRSAKILNSIMDILNLLFTILVLVVVPIIGFSVDGVAGLLTALIIFFITLPQTLPFILKMKKEIFS